MKKIILITIFALPLFIGACQKEKIDNNINAVKITATNSTDETLKTAFIFPTVNWQQNADHIGLYSDKAYTTAPGVFATNVDYHANQTGISSTFSSSTIVNWDGTTDIHKFYAYYPLGAGTPSSSAIPISLPATQTQVGATTNHIGPLDFEVATPVPLAGNPGANPAVAFVFNHLFAILKFNLTVKSGTAAASSILASVQLTSPSAPNLSLLSGIVDITQPTPAAGVPYTISSAAGGLTVTVNNVQTLNTTTPISVYMLVLAGNHAGPPDQNMTITYTNSLGLIETITNKKGINFQRGNVYTITDQISKW